VNLAVNPRARVLVSKRAGDHPVTGIKKCSQNSRLRFQINALAAVCPTC